jgi:hypothetical protein
VMFNTMLKKSTNFNPIDSQILIQFNITKVWCLTPCLTTCLTTCLFKLWNDTLLKFSYTWIGCLILIRFKLLLQLWLICKYCGKMQTWLWLQTTII